LKFIKLICLLVAIYPHFVFGGEDIGDVKNVISATFDKSNSKVITHIVVVQDNYAIADWSQLDKAGRALLVRKEKRWEISACGGAAIKQIDSLTKAGIPLKVSKKIIEELNIKEKSLGSKKLEAIDSFSQNSHH
jgi:hypothetical protein